MKQGIGKRCCVAYKSAELNPAWRAPLQGFVAAYVTLLPTTDNEDGTVSVESDQFSMYYLVEEH